MTLDPLCGTNTMIYVHENFDNVIDKLNVYIGLAKKFISKNKRFQYMKYVEKLPDDNWCLIFKILPSNHESVKEYNRMVEESKHIDWINYLNEFIEG